MLGAVFWIVEWVDTIGVLDEEWTGVERVEKQVSVIGYANVFGSAYLLLWTIPFGITTQLTGQIILGLASLAILSLLEVVDSVRDVRAMQDAFAASKPSLLLDRASNAVDSTPRFSEIVPLALLGLVSFYATGHQSAISSIQWKSAFVVTPTANYVFSPITVLLNSFGPLFLAAFAVPLLGLWNRSPANMNGNSKIMDTRARRASVIAGVGMMMYYTSLLLGTAVSAAILRRHLMVWKVFAPRFMAAVVGLILVDIAVLLGFTIGVPGPQSSFLPSIPAQRHKSDLLGDVGLQNLVVHIRSKSCIKYAQQHHYDFLIDRILPSTKGRMDVEFFATWVLYRDAVNEKKTEYVSSISMSLELSCHCQRMSHVGISAALLVSCPETAFEWYSESYPCANCRTNDYHVVQTQVLGLLDELASRDLKLSFFIQVIRGI
ncbi:hypothetical protein C8J56DRAFT_1113658 [Mycena floridula]|nr:hypothetical protein C8J56DRAFT_1113658 [Mycena floridula]